MRRRKSISRIELRDRTDYCGARLRDITVRVKDSDNHLRFHLGAAESGEYRVCGIRTVRQACRSISSLLGGRIGAGVAAPKEAR